MDARTSNPAAKTADREIVITRVVDAPRELVWNAMTDPAHVVQWWGPRGFTTSVEKMDLRPGGEWKHLMRGPDGTDYPNSSIFREVVKPERIVFSHSGGKKGNPGQHFLATWTFEALADKTRVTIHMLFPSGHNRDTVIREHGAFEGGKQTLERLGEYLAKSPVVPDESVHGSFVISRTFDAPRELMFRLWTDPAHMQHWWGPKGCTVVHSRMDLRPGGSYHYAIRTPDDQEMWGKFVFREIVKPERVVFVNCFSDKKGGVTRHPMNPAWPLETLSTITFTEHGGKTTVTICWSPLNATEKERETFEAGFDSMQQGWGGSFEQLRTYLAEIPMREVVFTRIYDAPRTLVWAAWTEPEHLAKWWGPEGFTNPVCQLDLRPGGALRIVMRAPDGAEYPMSGFFREIIAPCRLVFTTVAEDRDGNPQLEGLATAEFVELGGKTQVTVRASAVGLVVVAAWMLEGMEEGWKQSLVRLERLLART